jgi:RNA polymerase sigma-70 factor (ECF subfamily)
MHSEASTQSDSTLLESWCEHRSESAFAELVRRYERLVTGAALRRAGDLEVARDVAQQVFAMLAAKARLLIGRTSIAGWLYHAASHVAAQLRRSDARRLARHLAAADHDPDATDDHWGILEEALAELSASDREALLLHYFQDISYPEMAVQLGLSEAAVRKRVSRAVQSLARALRKHGLSSPKALLAGAAALQMTYPPQTALAASAIAGTSSISTPTVLIFHAVMSHYPVKIAICAASLALVPLGYEWNANAGLRTELAEARPQAARSTPSTGELSKVEETALTEMRAELARLETATKAAEARVAELSRFREQAKDEVVVSMGTIESMAKEFAKTVRQL